MRISPADYTDATRAALWMVCILYGLGGVLVGVSIRHVAFTGGLYVASLLAVAAICNTIILFFQRLSLPKIEAQLQAAIVARNGEAFARHIIRREMAKFIQPIGGLALTIGFLGEISVARLWL